MWDLVSAVELNFGLKNVWRVAFMKPLIRTLFLQCVQMTMCSLPVYKSNDKWMVGVIIGYKGLQIN